MAELQRALTFVAPIKKDDSPSRNGPEKRVAELIAAINAELRAWREGKTTTGRFPFWKMSSIHYARLMVMPGVRDIPSSLVISTNFDGEAKPHIDEMVQHGGGALDELMQHCEGYPGRGSLGDFIAAQDHGYGAFHVAKRWYTVQDIRREAALREHVQKLLDARSSWDGLDVHAELRRLLGEDPDWRWVLEDSPPEVSAAWKRGHEREIAGNALWFAAFWLPVAVLALGPLLLREYYDEWVYEEQERRELSWRRRIQELNDIARFAGQEDDDPVNQLSLVSDMRGAPRHLALRGVFYAIDALARAVYYRGFLGGIPSIHFARWAHVDKKKGAWWPWSERRLLFMSNYDGSWESYLGDFVDQEPQGLTGVWSNTRGFPPAHALAYIGGARDEQAFKRWAREQQFETGVWYAAYPELTVANIMDNSRLRRGLHLAELDPKLREKWLRLL